MIGGTDVVMELRHEVSLLVTQPREVVQQRLRDVEGWAAFLLDVEHISKVAHERYLFSLGRGHHARDVLAAVREHPIEHTFVWTALRGPSFDGVIRLADAESHWTRVTLTMARWPDGFLAGLSELVMPGRDHSGIDEDQLRNHLHGAGAQSQSQHR
jgi:uncharacterized membrane protein